MQTIHLMPIFFFNIFLASTLSTEYLWDKPNNCTNKKGQAKTPTCTKLNKAELYKR